MIKIIHNLNHEAAWAFVPQPSGVRITAFRPHNNYDYFPDPKMGWSEIVGGQIEVVEAGNNPHGMLIRPHVCTLADELRKRILKKADL